MNGWEKKPIDRMEMMHILGIIYGKTASRLVNGGLARLIKTEGKPTVTVKYTFILKALVRKKIIIPDGKVGRRRAYRWNLKQYGPVSLPIADMIITETEEQIRMDAAKRRETKKLKEEHEQES